MKPLVILILLGAPVFGADTTITNIVGDITTRISERTKDGKMDVRIETTYRGKTKVMMTISRPNREGGLAVQSRSLYADGKLVAAESDEDGDGTLDSITVFSPGTDEFEVFTRLADGTVKPISTRSRRRGRRSRGRS
jgi:hypothetical protein